jgi:hypothetical protein
MEISKMLTKTKIVLAAALILGTVSVALAANEHDDSVSETQALREHGNPLPWWWNAPAQGRASSFAQAPDAYGYAASPKKTHRVTHEHTQDR